MPQIEIENATYLTSSYWRHGKILDIDKTREVVKVGILDNNENISHIIEDVPVFFHCSPDAEKNTSGGLKDAIFAFEVGDMVAIYFNAENAKVVANLTKKRKCRRSLYLIFNNIAYEFDIDFDSVTLTFNSQIILPHNSNTFTFNTYEFPENYVINQHYGIIEKIRVMEQGTDPWYNRYWEYKVWQYISTPDNIEYKIENIIKDEFYFAGTGPESIPLVSRRISDKIIVVNITDYLIYTREDNNWELTYFYTHNLDPLRFVYIDENGFVYYITGPDIWKYHPEYGPENVFSDPYYNESNPEGWIFYLNEEMNLQWFKYATPSYVRITPIYPSCGVFDMGEIDLTDYYVILGEKPDFMDDYDLRVSEAHSRLEGDEYQFSEIVNLYRATDGEEYAIMPNVTLFIPNIFSIGGFYAEQHKTGLEVITGDPENVFAHSFAHTKKRDFVQLYILDKVIKYEEEYNRSETVNIDCDNYQDRYVCCYYYQDEENHGWENCDTCSHERDDHNEIVEGDRIRRLSYIAEDDLQAVWIIRNSDSILFLRIKNNEQWSQWINISSILDYIPLNFPFSEEDIWGFKFGLCYF